jgi:hypothetical protein
MGQISRSAQSWGWLSINPKLVKFQSRGKTRIVTEVISTGVMFTATVLAIRKRIAWEVR